MLTVDEAFRKFRTRLEPSGTEEGAASRRQRRIREQLDADLDISNDFLTGAYVRHTKTKPLHDVDIMVVLADEAPLSDHPRRILDTVTATLRPHYGDARVKPDRRAVRVDFGVKVVDDVADDDVMSFDVVPAFVVGDHFLIPDDVLGEWIPTNPQIHKDKATEANKAFSDQWKPLVKMAKKWNDHNGSPVDPSFLIEVLALDLISGEWTGSHPREIRQFFASAADRIGDSWPDPAGVGPEVNDVLLADSSALAAARRALVDAERACTEAMRLDRAGRVGDALDAWQKLFGPLFAKS
jgi:Second Messenger Oligonucleotide or Dinucleotide Synthetase domain